MNRCGRVEFVSTLPLRIYGSEGTAELMQPGLKARVLRVAERIQISRHYQELVADMAQLSDEWNASSAHMQKGLETGDIDLLSRSILENRKQAKMMDYVLRRYERIVAKLGEQS